MSTAAAASTRMAKARLTAGRARIVSNQRLRCGKSARSWPMPLGEPDPADAGHVGDGIAAGQKLAPGKPRVHDAEQAVDLVGVAGDGVGDRLRRVTAEVIGLAGHRAEPADLPEQPLLDGDARALLARIKFAGLAAEILQDGAGLEDRDRPPARAGGIDDRRDAVVRRDRQKVRRELLAFGNVDGTHDVGQAALFEHDRDLPAVRRRPVIELDRLDAARRPSLCRRRGLRLRCPWRARHGKPSHVTDQRQARHCDS